MKQPDYKHGGVKLYHGDCVEVMRSMAACSVDTIITDPPYHLTQTSRNGSARKPGTGPFGRVHVGERGFMGKTWDGGGIAFDPEMWATVLHVAKPGAFLLAFGGTRTFHRLACALEEAGWQIRDCLMWLYGSGFPKSLDISKAIDKAAGAERKRIRGVRSSVVASTYAQDAWSKEYKDSVLCSEPMTDAAKQWHGWGTALKPAWEPIIVAMKPLDGTFVRNALKHGVAGLNIDRGRTEYQNDSDKLLATPQGRCTSKELSAIGAEPDACRRLQRVSFDRPDQKGRWPANVLLSHHPECEYVGHEQVNSNGHYPSRCSVGGIGASGHRGRNELVEHHTAGEIVERWRCHPHCPVTMLDQQSGQRKAGSNLSGNEPSTQFKNCFGRMNHRRAWFSYGDTGGASRFFYCAKASKKERDLGLRKGLLNGHPTVKPLKLMEYLCKLTATPAGGIILDPFAGSGSTLIAAQNVGRKCIGIECDREYVRIAQAKLRACTAQHLKGGSSKAA